MPADPSFRYLPQETFAPVAQSYLTSKEHRSGADLDLILTWSQTAPPGLAVDVATGGGHTARAVASTGRRVIATDLTIEMLQTAATEHHDLVSWVAAEAASQPLPPASAHVVTCRIAPHHFVRLGPFLGEAHRVLAPTGTLCISDNISHPATEAWLNHVERVRDPSHVRSYTLDEWTAALEEAGFEITELKVVAKRKSFSGWLYRTRPGPAAVRTVTDAFLEAPDEISRLHQIEIEDGRVVSWSDQKIVVAARPR